MGCRRNINVHHHHHHRVRLTGPYMQGILILILGGDGGNGTATISTKSVFDREKQKYYYIPIVMWDMRGKNDPQAMTGTNTLTVTIADINDNRPEPGHQEIFVYNYKGVCACSLHFLWGGCKSIAQSIRHWRRVCFRC